MLHPDFGGDAKRVLKAQDRSQAIIGFEPNGTIIAANENFCRLVGYEPAELKGKHHSMFADPETANSPDYKAFWAKLGRGESGLPGSPRLSLLWNATTHGGHMSESGKAGTSKGSELIAFNIGAQEFCVGTTSVREIRGWTATTALPHAPAFVLGVVNLRGVVLPIVDLALQLGFPPTEPTARHAIIVVECGNQVVGLLVDGVSDIFIAGEDQIQPTPDIAAETAKLFLRGVIATDGRLVGVVNVANLLPPPESIAA